MSDGFSTALSRNKKMAEGKPLEAVSNLVILRKTQSLLLLGGTAYKIISAQRCALLPVIYQPNIYSPFSSLLAILMGSIDEEEQKTEAPESS